MHWLVAVRYVVFAIVLLSALIALAAWAVRTRTVDPFSGLGRFLRSLSEPIVKPVEKKLVKSGGNPQTAAWWIFGVPLVVGLLVIAFAGWVDTQVATVMGARSARGVIRLVVSYTGWLVMIALFIRVIGTWVGLHRETRMMRPVYLLTDWIVEPIRKFLPSVGGLDFSPMVAWVILTLLLGWILKAL